MNINQNEINLALTILIQTADRAIERGGYSRKQVIDIDWAIKTLTEPAKPEILPVVDPEAGKNHKPEKEKIN